MSAEPKRVELTDAERVAVFDALAKINNPAGATALLYAVEDIKAAARREALLEAADAIDNNWCDAIVYEATDWMRRRAATLAEPEPQYDQANQDRAAAHFHAALAEPERDEEGGQ